MAQVKSSQKSIFPALPNTVRGQFIVLGGAGAEAKQKNTFLYCSGKNVFIRDIEKSDVCKLYCNHGYPPTVAKYNRNGAYIASGDSSGKVLVWSTENEEAQATEINAVRKVKDIAWSPDLKKDMLKVAIGGDGGGNMAIVVDANNGSSRGNISGQLKAVNQLDYSQVPYAGSPKFRIVTASEDQKIHFFEGSPFKYKLEIDDHTNFVNCVRYSPTGECFISGGADGQAFIFNGQTADREGALIDGSLKDKKAHSGGIYGICFKPSGEEILTVSADKTAKIWNVANRELLATYTLGKELYDMQVGCLWQEDHIMTVSLSGFINFLNRSDTSGGIHTPLKVYKGHNRPISAMCPSPDSTKLFTAGLYSVGPTSTTSKALIRWDLATGLAEEVQGNGHTSKINDVIIVGNTLISISMDDTIRFSNLSSVPVTYGNPCKLPSQPIGVAAISDTGLVVAVSCMNHILILDNECRIVFQQEVKFTPSKIDINSANGSTLVAVGGVSDKQVHIFKLEGNQLIPLQKINAEDDVVDLKFSPDGSHLAVGTGSRKYVQLYERDSVDQFTQKYSEVKHTAKVLSVSWRSDSKFFASGSLDGSVCIWATDKKPVSNYIHFMKGVHLKAEVSRVRWISDNTIATCSDDCNIKQFTVEISS